MPAAGSGSEIAIAMARAGAQVLINDIGASLGGEGRSADSRGRNQAADRAGRRRRRDQHRLRRGMGFGAEDRAGGARPFRPARCGGQQCRHLARRDLSPHVARRIGPSVISVHLNGCFFISRAAADQYRKQESGAYVHVTSTSGRIGNMGQANYASAKLGITALSKSIAIDMKRFNVRSNCLSPWAWSRMTQSIPARTPEQQARVAETAADDARQERAFGGVSGIGRGARRHRPGVGRADERAVPVQFAAADPRRASRRRLDPGGDRRTRAAGIPAARSCRSTPRAKCSPGTRCNYRPATTTDPATLRKAALIRDCHLGPVARK